MQDYQYDKEALIADAENHRYADLKEKLTHLNEVDVADFIGALPPPQVMIVFGLLEKEVAADVFANLPIENQEQLINSLDDQQLSTIIDDLSVDDAVDMIGELPANIVRKVLRNAKPETRQLINHYLRYPDDSVGSIMTSEFVDLKRELTIKEAIDRIRSTGEDKETIYTCYVTDQEHHLEGTASIKDLLLAKDDQHVEDVMEKDIISVTTTDDQEVAARLFNKYDFVALPVVDAENRLVGIVTVDDAVDVMQDEATEDIEKMAAMQPSEKPYLKTGVVEMAKHRILWLLILMVSGMITGSILERFTDAFVAIPLLVTFIPMLTDTGGNAGSQSSALIIRGLAVGEVEPRDWVKIMWKELRVSILVGLVLAAVNFIRIVLTYRNVTMMIAFTVSLTMFFTVLLAKLIGGLLPLLAKKIHVDPAIMAAPLITTIVDAMSLVIYFTIAKELLGV
ncbi:MAG: magnesium transporter [Sphaerochaeta sp.]|jgi:magnesium transporter|nr:magnesium transporter [Sphaerochaeta sp.]MCH3920579.1 magnesium transporter [Sphaerochaeta sp.]MCI2096615.1 magnesium transporter [Sphaerochaeta sp.]MCI2103560.1 magnesium transporter [Sphaerochaeta sp.]